MTSLKPERPHRPDCRQSNFAGRIRKWLRFLPLIRLVSLERLRQPLKHGQRRLVVNGKIIIIDTS